MEEKIILLIEDNPDDIDLTLRAFKKNNIVNKIIIARDGEEALEHLFGANAVKPTLVLLDLKLPKIDGLEVLRKIRSNEKTKLYPVVVLTSSTEQSDLKAAYELGSNSYIKKPVNFEVFLEAVHKLGVYWLILNEPPVE
ncbi:MAG: response regulator [Bacteroidota bacterium]|nr:response regulator [Bacteroidota bacterium]